MGTLMKVSLLLSSGDDASLLLAVARQAERRGLAALWLPEQHNKTGGLFPNPAVAAAAVAVATRRIGVRAGGLALPLHNPIRVAEEWSLVDNLSGGRVGIAFGSADGDRAGIETVRRFWRGEAVRVPDGEGRPIEVRILPQPVQRELPLWRILPEHRAAGGGERVTGMAPAFASAEEGLRELKIWEETGVDEVACRVRLADALDALDVLEEILRRREVDDGG
jgi:alkanesulfonate monooxygenase SsuD/methylene tetrahydromethanopterin reductase-like flavin-dependent oxidoreductase (luciferase family)